MEGADQMTNTISNLPSKMFSGQKHYECLPLGKSSGILKWCFGLVFYLINTQTNIFCITEECFYIHLFNCCKKIDFLAIPSMHLEGR